MRLNCTLLALVLFALSICIPTARVIAQSSEASAGQAVQTLFRDARRAFLHQEYQKSSQLLQSASTTLGELAAAQPSTKKLLENSSQEISRLSKSALRGSISVVKILEPAYVRASQALTLMYIERAQEQGMSQRESFARSLLNSVTQIKAGYRWAKVSMGEQSALAITSAHEVALRLRGELGGKVSAEDTRRALRELQAATKGLSNQ